MKNTVQNWFKRATLVAVTGVGLVPMTAQARERFDLSIRFGDPVVRRPDCVTQIWVEPVYRTVSERVRVEPVYKTICEDVCVPARHETTERVCFEHGRRVTRLERVLIPAHTERVERRVCMSEGRYDCVEHRVVVCAGHYETQTLAVEVSHRHWERPY